MVASVFNFPPSLRTSAHTGVAIRIPLGTMLVDQLPTKDCHVALVLLAMTSENRSHYRYHGSAARRAHGSSARPKSTSSGDALHLRQGGARHARLNRVTRTVAKWFAQSTSEWPKTLPRGFKGPQPLGTPFSPIFRRATKDGAAGGHCPPSAARKTVKHKNRTHRLRCVLCLSLMY